MQLDRQYRSKNAKNGRKQHGCKQTFQIDWIDYEDKRIEFSF